jgi:2',3'-cyclic-nucleotide 2'-phosphodiesterase
LPSLIKVLFVGDIIGVPGMELTAAILKGLLERHHVDFCIANGENVTDGKGISEEDAKKVFDLGVHVITTGNHVWDRWDSRKVLGGNRNILRPINYPRENGGNGFVIYDLGEKGKIGVINAQGRTFMQPLDDPFRTIDWALTKINEQTKIAIIDFHAEATAEKAALGWYLDGRASALLGTHTHVPTADARILSRGTAFISDVGMTGPYDSVIGMKKDQAVQRFLKQTPFKYETASNDVHFCSVLLTIDTETGLTVGIEQLVFPKF